MRSGQVRSSQVSLPAASVTVTAIVTCRRCRCHCHCSLVLSLLLSLLPSLPLFLSLPFTASSTATHSGLTGAQSIASTQPPPTPPELNGAQSIASTQPHTARAHRRAFDSLYTDPSHHPSSPGRSR